MGRRSLLQPNHVREDRLQFVGLEAEDPTTWGEAQAERYIRGLFERFEANSERRFPLRDGPPRTLRGKGRSEAIGRSVGSGKDALVYARRPGVDPIPTVAS